MTIQKVVLSETPTLKVLRFMYVPNGYIDLGDPTFYTRLETALNIAITEAVGHSSYSIYSAHNSDKQQIERIVIIGDSNSLA